MDEPFVGEIILAGFNFPPVGWAVCDGRILRIEDYNALFSLIGNTYGGDGQTTFALPDLRGRVPVCIGAGPGMPPVSLAEKAGQETVPLAVGHLAAHTHSVAAGTTAGTESPVGAVYGGGAAVFAAPDASPVSMNPGMVQPAGGSQPHENRMPYLALNYLIALEGIYPERP